VTTSEWRTLTLAREALLNLATLRAPMMLAVLIAGVLGSASSAFAAFEGERFSERLAALESRGSEIITFGPETAQSVARISRASCEALAREPGVRRAGLLVDEGTRDFAELGARTAVFSASSTLFPALSHADGLIGADLGGGDSARRIVFAPGDVRALLASEAQPEGVPTNSAVVVPLSPSTDSSPYCLVELRRYQEVDEDVEVLGSRLQVTGGAITGLPRLRLTTDPVLDWRTRPGQVLPLALGAAGGLLTLVLIGRRSHELAAYRLSGTSRRSLALLLTLEGTLIAGVFVLSGALAAFAFGGRLISVPESLAWTLAGGAAWSMVTLIGIGKAILTSPAALAKPR